MLGFTEMGLTFSRTQAFPSRNKANPNLNLNRAPLPAEPEPELEQVVVICCSNGSTPFMIHHSLDVTGGVDDAMQNAQASDVSKCAFEKSSSQLRSRHEMIQTPTARPLHAHCTPTTRTPTTHPPHTNHTPATRPPHARVPTRPMVHPPHTRETVNEVALQQLHTQFTA